MNPGFVSYYRTEYSRELGAALDRALARPGPALQPVDRLSTLEDRVSLVLGEQGNTVALMRLISRLHCEDSFLVWKNLSSFFHVLRCIVWSSEDLATRFDRFVVAVMVPCLERIGWSRTTGESHLTSLLRGLLICQLGTRGSGITAYRTLSKSKLRIIGDEKLLIPELSPQQKIFFDTSFTELYLLNQDRDAV